MPKAAPIALITAAALLALAFLPYAGNRASSIPGEATAHLQKGITHMEKSENADAVYVRVLGKDGTPTGPVRAAKVERTDEEWKEMLTPEQYRIMRNKGTEPAFCGGLLDNKDKGYYLCRGCNLPLYESSAKFDSRTGWPSFFQPVADENILERADFSHGMSRVEILCKRCESHLGHVFTDGPEPTGLRHCLNSESLVFVAYEQAAALGEDIKPANIQEVVFAGGCFWCVEAVFEEIDGVVEALSGYAGGTADTANYKAVSSGRTDHAEVVKIIYDADRVALEDLLRVHFATHDPTTLNRQGNDIGPQYRSSIFYANDEERQIAEAFIADLGEAGVFGKPIVTKLEPLDAFYMAEGYHQNYACRNPNNPYIRGVSLPKVDKVRKLLKAGE